MQLALALIAREEEVCQSTLARNHIPTLRTEIDRIRIVKTLAHGSWTIAFSWRFAWYISVISASQQRPFR